MKRLTGLIAVVIFLVGSSVAIADPDEAWFTLEGTTCADVFATGGAANQTLSITKPNVATCDFTFGYNVTATERPIYAYAFQFFDSPDISLVSFDYSPGDALGFDEFHIQYNTPGSFIDIGALHQSIHGVLLPASGALLARFTVRVSKPNAGLHELFGDYGTFAQPYEGGYLWYGGVGPNANTFGQANYPGQEATGWGTLPVITINNIPEPATLGLLGIGALALIRRRR